VHCASILPAGFNPFSASKTKMANEAIGGFFTSTFLNKVHRMIFFNFDSATKISLKKLHLFVNKKGLFFGDKFKPT
jgi:hypothetical protein